MKIIVMTCIPMIQQHLTDLYVEDLSESFTVELWDLSGLYQRDEQVSHRIDRAVKINSLEMLETALKQSGQDTVVLTNIMFYSLKRIYKSVKQFNYPIINITKEGLAYYLFASNWRSFNPAYGFTDALKMLLRKIGLLRRVSNLLINGRVKYDYLLANGNFYPEYTRDFVKIHHVKYDEVLSSQSTEPVLDEPYILFLDTAATSHPFYGLKRHVNKRKIDAADYIHKLNAYFALLEKDFSMPVVIAAHPKADYSESTFGGRRIIKYQSGALIRHSQIVLSHYSTSVINAVLLYKPLIFLYYPEMFYGMQKYMAIGAIEFAHRLKSPVINLNKIHSTKASVDKRAYDQFISRFIVNKSKESQSNKEMILDFFHHLDHSFNQNQIGHET